MIVALWLSGVFSRRAYLLTTRECVPQNVLPNAWTLEVKAYIHDTLAFLYYKRKKPYALVEFAQRALKAHCELEQVPIDV